jgi:methenyltetrahydromethanopterin cyclohydrolase
MDFKGTNETQVMTMFAHAKRGEINYSTNPTFLEYGQENIFYSSSAVYEENTELKLKNIASSSYDEFNAPFERQVYISRVGIYDKDKNLIAVATLSNPILKKEAEDISFKLKLDI